MWRCLALLLSLFSLCAQNESGELRLNITDQAGLPVPTTIELLSNSNEYRRTLEASADGKLIAKRLPFGIYRIKIQKPGFNPYSELIEIRSAIPLERTIVLGVAAVETTLVVSEAGTLLDPHRTGSPNRIGSETLLDRPSSGPGRSIVDLVNTQPGWLLEANAILHPRGSEYQTQYVVNGIPLTDNRSPAFAPEIGADDVQSMNVLTANYPAEYGRKLGGVIEVITARDSRPGFHGRVSASGGSFETAGGYAQGQYGWDSNTLSLSGAAARTSRYLDSPVEANYTNRGTTGSFATHFERDLSPNDRFGVIVRREQSRFLVPNEQVQQDAGQRQDRNSGETAGQISYQHIFSPHLIGDLRVMARDLSAALWSNSLSTPIIAAQDRGFREAYFKSALSAHFGPHELKVGVEGNFGSVNEAFSYRITNRRAFDSDTARRFSFADRAQDREQAIFVQDLVRFGNFTFSAGVRWDHYGLLISANAASPRFGAAWYWPAADLILRASYDRVFQTPAFENLLLASSPSVVALNDNVLRIPLRPSKGNFYEGGFAKGLFHKLRVDANYFYRQMDDFADDDLLLNTGVSFPTSFRKAEIHGIEAKLELPRWGPFSGFLSYSNLVGYNYLPVTGGFFLGDEAAALLASNDRFPITQDQRNTARARLRYQIAKRAWIAGGGSYGSGLPVEIEGTPADLSVYSPRILDRVDFERGRVRPSFSLDASFGADLWKTEHKTLRFQIDGQNLTNRLNVIDFAGLFSGTALAAPRASARLTLEF